MTKNTNTNITFHFRTNKRFHVSQNLLILVCCCNLWCVHLKSPFMMINYNKRKTDLFTISNKNIALVWSRLCSSLLFFKLRFHRATNQCKKNQNQKKTTNIRFRFRTNKRFQVSKHRSHWVSHLCSYCIYYCSFSTFSSSNSLITHILVCDID